MLLSETSGGRRDLACLLAWAAVVLSQPDPCLPLLLEDKRAVVILLYAYGRTTTKPAPSLAAHTTTMNKEAPRLLPVEPRLAGRSCGVLTRLREPDRHDFCRVATATAKVPSCNVKAVMYAAETSEGQNEQIQGLGYSTVRVRLTASTQSIPAVRCATTFKAS